MRTLRISVRRLVEFLLRSGDIDAAGDGRGSVEAMQAGSNIHRMLQAAGGNSYQAEVPLAGSVFFPAGSFNSHAARLDISEEAVANQQGFFLCVEGRADGIIDDGAHSLVIDEIKGVARDVSAIEEPAVLHEAQALCYAYLYLRKTRGAAALATAFGEQVTIRLTYASMTTGEVRQIERTHTVPGIEAWFFSLLEEAQRWAAWRVTHDELCRRSLVSLEFPLTPRDGQRQIMDAVATTIREGRRLYVQAPTGSGKTIATLFPALKTLGEGAVSRVAYLTAKTLTRRSALECVGLLRRQEFAANVLVVTARNKICPLRKNARGDEVRARPLASLCNPLECPLARGHYNAANDALYEAITSYDVLDSAAIEKVAAAHHVCPYELQRDAARWCDVIVCDYHFAFAPSASLMGLADEPGDAGTVYLVDEAHNLVERMREMYSAGLSAAALRELERLVRARRDLGELVKAVRAVIAAFPTWEKTLPVASTSGRKAPGVVASGSTAPPGVAVPFGAKAQGRATRPGHQVVHLSDTFVEALATLADGLDAALEQLFSTVSDTGGGGYQAGSSAAGPPFGSSAVGSSAASFVGPSGPSSDLPASGPFAVGSTEVLLSLRDANFSVRSFLGALQRSETGYVTFLERADDGRMGHGQTGGDGRRLKIFCVDPSHDLEQRLEQATAAVFFSGTLLPMDYHRKLLAAQEGDASVYARSSFDYGRQQVLVATDVSARYSRRGPELYGRIAAYVVALAQARPGNYLVFVPSYAMLGEVATALGKVVRAAIGLDRQLPGGRAASEHVPGGRAPVDLAPSSRTPDNHTRSAIRIVRQLPGMREEERQRYVDGFRAPRAAETSLVGLCVLGGIFGESIDLPGEALVGVVVVGTGMPRTSGERDVIKDYFDARTGKGFAYAYTYPGMIKVLQAAGRLMRTEQDQGVVLLLDDRFLENELREAFPKEWQNVRACTLATMPGILARN